MKLSKLKKLVLQIEDYFDNISNTQPSSVCVYQIEYDTGSIKIGCYDSKGNELESKIDLKEGEK